jgi:hypothetical protein
MRARPATRQVQGVRRGVDMRARSATLQVQGVQIMTDAPAHTVKTKWPAYEGERDPALDLTKPRAALCTRHGTSPVPRPSGSPRVARRAGEWVAGQVAPGRTSESWKLCSAACKQARRSRLAADATRGDAGRETVGRGPRRARTKREARHRRRLVSLRAWLGAPSERGHATVDGRRGVYFATQPRPANRPLTTNIPDMRDVSNADIPGFELKRCGYTRVGLLN